MNSDEYPQPSASPAGDLRPSSHSINPERPQSDDRWTPRADADLLARYQAGRSIDELAEEFGRKSSAIASRLTELAFEMLRQHRLGSHDPGG